MRQGADCRSDSLGVSNKVPQRFGEGYQRVDESIITIGSSCRLQRHAQATYFDLPALAG